MWPSDIEPSTGSRPTRLLFPLRMVTGRMGSCRTQIRGSRISLFDICRLHA
jgi:hypothetical protein